MNAAPNAFQKLIHRVLMLRHFPEDGVETQEVART